MSVVQLSSRWRASGAAAESAHNDSSNGAILKMSVAVKASLALIDASKAVVAAAGLMNDLSEHPRSVSKADLSLALEHLDRQLSALKCLHERMKRL